MKKDYFTINEWAQVKDCRVQNIYNQLKKQDNDLNKYLDSKNGKKVIKKQAIELLTDDQKEIAKNYIDLKEEAQEQSAFAEDDTKTNLNEDYQNNKIIELLERQVEDYRNEVKQKNLQIETLQEQLSNSQKLLAIEKQEKQALLNGGQANRKGLLGQLKGLIFREREEEI